MNRLVITVVAFALVAATPAQAEVFTVNTQADTSVSAPCNSIQCSLRSAIAAAQGNAETDGIVLPAGTYTLTNGALSIQLAGEGISIIGAGAGATTILNGGNDRLFSLTGSSSALGLNSVTLSGGVAPGAGLGGSILGGIDTTLAIYGSRVTDGFADHGGAIYSAGTVSLVNSVIDHNTATAEGGGVMVEGGDALLQAINTTFAFNTAASGGAIAARGTSSNGGVTIIHATIAHNHASGTAGGGLNLGSAPGSFLTWGSIVAENVGHVGSLDGPSNCGGAALSEVGGANVESGVDCGFVRADDRQGALADLSPGLVDAGGDTLVLTIPATSPAAQLENPCSTSLVDQRGAARAPDACDSGAYEEGSAAPGGVPMTPTPVVTPTATPVVTPAPTAVPTPAPTPQFAQSVVVKPVSGKVLVRRPGGKDFVEIDATEGIPLGSTVDAKRGVIELASVPKRGGTPEKAKFRDGIFKVTQAGGITQLALTETLAPCPKPGTASAAAKKPKSRKLWGDGSGSFRTKGKYSAATVRGTNWLVQDSCAGTLTQVRQGTVSVHDTVRNRTILVRKGKSYLARPRR